MKNLERVLFLCDDICWDGAFFIEIRPLKKAKDEDCPFIILCQESDDDSEGGWGVLTNKINKQGSYELAPVGSYPWPEWFLEQEVHITVTNS